MSGTALVERSDRVARDLMVSEVILRRLADLDVQGDRLRQRGPDLTVADGDPTRKLVRQLLAAVARVRSRHDGWPSCVRPRERIRMARGRCEGLPPFGEREGEQETLQRAQALRRKPRGCKAMSFAKIAAVLNSEDRRTRRGGLWQASGVRRILSGRVAALGTVQKK